MRQVKRSYPVRLLSDAGWFTIAYVSTAYFACSAHKSFANALSVHAYLYLVALLLWCPLAFWRHHVSSRNTETFVSHLHFAAQMLLAWAVLVLVLLALFHPDQLDGTEALVFGGTIMLLFSGRCLLRFFRWDVVRCTCLIFWPAINGRHPNVVPVIPRPLAALLNSNTVRGSPL